MKSVKLILVNLPHATQFELDLLVFNKPVIYSKIRHKYSHI